MRLFRMGSRSSRSPLGESKGSGPFDADVWTVWVERSLRFASLTLLNLAEPFGGYSS